MERMPELKNLADTYGNATEAILGGINWLESKLMHPRILAQHEYELRQMLPYVICPTDKPNIYQLGNWSYNRIGSNVEGDQIGTLFEDGSNQEFYIPPALYRKLKTPGKDGIYLYPSYGSLLIGKPVIKDYVKHLRWVWEQILEIKQNAHLRYAYYR